MGRGGYRWGRRKADRSEPPEPPALPVSQWPSAAERAYRKVNSNGELSFAGVVYNVGRAWAGDVVEVFALGRNFYIVAGESVIKRHPAKHSAAKGRAALADKRGGAR